MQLDRRAAAQGIAAGILAVPAAALATSGDFPKVRSCSVCSLLHGQLRTVYMCV
jgi:hypothetical protein